LLNKREIRRKWERFREDYARADKRRAKLIGVSVLLAIALICLAVTVGPLLKPHRRTREVDTAAWRLARELNEAVTAKQEFMDTGFVVESERPLKLRLTGGVRTQKDLEDLRQFVSQLRPDAPADQLVVDVEILAK
jgi:hypothetical protein